ncbi:MAG: WG repeat-containing protein [Stenotrophomonas sp.]
MQPLPGCELIEGHLRITAAAVATLEHDHHRLAAMFAGGSSSCVTRQGRAQAVISWDNAPDYLEEGWLPGRVGSRIGCFDADLKPAFPTTFDFGGPFENRIAEACCRRGTPDADGHVALTGGQRFRIDRQGQRLPDDASP